MTDGGSGSGDETAPEPATGNHHRGSARHVVQAGAVHGDVYLTSGAAESAIIPRQLPLAPARFVNRRADLALLDALLPGAGGAGGAASPSSLNVVVITGPPGVGKTALALHWAHRVRSLHEDGDLYVNMRGHGIGPRVDTSSALLSLLRAMGVPLDRIPDDLDGRAALYRSRLDRKRVLVAIDDAVSADQVRALLPASAPATVLITSRNRLSGLAVYEGARRMALHALSVEESLELLRAGVGADRVDAEPEAARELVDHCARLPLALRVLSERVMDRPGYSLGEVAAELRAEDERLDALGTADDELSGVRAVFSTSYSALPPDCARLFRSLGAHPDAEFSGEACAAAVGLDPKAAVRVLDVLVARNLLQRTTRHRYRLHDLLRVYAVERFRTEEPPRNRGEILKRLAGWYLANVRRALAVCSPNFPSVDVPEPRPTGGLLDFTGTEDALAWFDVERPNIVGIVRAVHDAGLLDLAWRIPVAAYGFFELSRRWEEWRLVNTIGHRAARSMGHRYGEGRNLIGLADAEWLLGDKEEALTHYEAALGAGREAEDPWTEGFALRQIGLLRWELDRSPSGPELLRQAAAVFRAAGERRGEGMALLGLADCAREAGRLDEAAEHCREAMSVFTRLPDSWTVAWARYAMANVLRASGRHRAAVAEYRAALDVFVGDRDLDTEALARTGLGESYAALGETESARMHLGAALDLLRSVSDPRADSVAAAIARLDGESPKPDPSGAPGRGGGDRDVR
ncbi:ATP-binding protein [Streptomonospora nanhaiensis]|uniref:ATP-binding protein n=1 Tax=Streptomonospora nanhaiensis TaxID=1323731 RepID=UPI001FE47A8B|nr:tetratricopeptide repeat protein [Streptomonospora nanhaiensis]